MQELDLDDLQDSVAKCISQSQYCEAMERIKSFAEQVINDPELVAVVFASRELDDLCRTLANSYYAGRAASPADGRGTVILATELVRAGGHVELIKDYLASRLFEGPVHVVLTDLFNRIDPAVVPEWESLLGCEVFVTSQAGLDDKLEALTAKLEEWRPSNVLTLGHNQDVVCVVGAHFPGTTNRYYIHHGDHHMSLGVTCEAFQHVDLHNMSFDLCKYEIGVARQLYWPLSAVRPSETRSSFLDRGALTTCSCGRTSKFESGSYALRYERAVACILRASRGYHVHIGELPEAFLQRIYQELDAENISRDRFIHIEWVASLSRALIENSVDVYVASFPLGGGKALIEAMSVGLPVVTHESYRSRYHGGSDLAYPESYSWRGYDELRYIFERWDKTLLKQQAESALLHFRRYYSKEAFLSAFASGADCALHVPPLRSYRLNRLQNYLDLRRRRMGETAHLVAEKDRIFSEWVKVSAEYERCKQMLADPEGDRDRIFAEWKKVHAAYEACRETITQQQAIIEQLTQDKEALKAAYAAIVHKIMSLRDLLDH